MWHLGDEWQAQERIDDMLRAAERQRQIEAALGKKVRRTDRYAAALIWIGRRLTAWGEQLRTHRQEVELGR